MDLGQRLLLERYLELLYAEPTWLNLTRIAPADAWSRHIEESLDLLPLRPWAPGERVIDLGSGAGIPGIPLAVARDRLEVQLVERDQAKAAFLLRCLSELGLTGVSVLARDALEASRQPGFEPADVLVSRAAVPPPRLLRLAPRLLRPSGEGLLHVGGSLDLTPELQLLARRSGLDGLRLEASGRSWLLRFARLAA